MTYVVNTFHVLYDRMFIRNAHEIIGISVRAYYIEAYDRHRSMIDFM